MDSSIDYDMDTSINMDDLQINSEIISDSDRDDCDEIELQKAFRKTFTISAEKALSLHITYILHMDYLNQKICVGLSNNTCEIHEIRENQVQKLCSLTEHSSYIVNVKFSIAENLLYTGSADGTIKLWDLRTPKKSVNNFQDSTSSPENMKPFSCFDVSQNNRVICAGTELFEGDAFIIFWDVRNTKLLGGYWESHMDDITKVSFHPTNKDKLASCSTDGLINIYDLTQTSEDDALTCSLNTESSVEQIVWYTQNQEDAIACVTHPCEVQLWQPEEGTYYAKFTREMLSKEIKRTSPEHCYVANIHPDESRENLVLLTGSNWHNGERVRGLNVINNQLSPNFILHDNKQRIRTSYFDIEEEILITGGERGILSVWKPTDDLYSNTSKKEIIGKQKLHLKKPY